MRIRLRVSALRSIIREEALREIDIEDISDERCVTGSTHVMKTCKIGDRKFFLKFSDELLFDSVDPSLQILVEYLAYEIYRLYPSVRIPDVEPVYDRKGKRVGLATSAVSGEPGLVKVSPKKLGSMLSAGVFVDVFLANWDVVGTGTGNVIVSDGSATRIDPGGALTFRAQGGRKGEKFSGKAGELKTMLDPGFGGAGEVLSYADASAAAKEFMSVPFSSVASVIKRVHTSVSSDLSRHGMSDLLSEWDSDVAEIASKLKTRHSDIVLHAKTVAKG